MTTVETTPNFKFAKPLFDLRVWHTYVNANFDVIDAVLQQYLAVNNLQGVWQNSTHYLVGQTVVDSVQGIIYNCLVEHTSATVPSTFAQDRTANPSYWGGIVTPEHFKGAWAQNTSYSVRDFVVSGAIYAVCITAHTSTATGTFGDDAVNWLYLINASSFNLPSITGKGTNYLRARADETGLEYRTPAQVAADIGAGTGTVTTVNTGTGLGGGPINTAGVIFLGDTAVAPGTYNMPGSITIDQQGRITSATAAGFASTDVARLSVANVFLADQQITTTTAGAGAGPNLTQLRNKGAGVAADLIGLHLFAGMSSTSVQRSYAGIQAKIISPANTAETGELHLQTINAGALADRLVIGPTGVYTPLATGGDKGADSINAKNFYIDGVQLSAGSGFKNYLLNGGMHIWQRGAGGSASIAVAASTIAYTADRWYLSTSANQASVVSQQTGPSLKQRYAARIQRNAGQTGTATMVFACPLDADIIASLAGLAVNLSANVSTGANWSPASGNLVAKVYCGTSAVGKRNGTPYAGETAPINATQAIAAGSAAADINFGTGTIPLGTTSIEIAFQWTPVGTAGANDWPQITSVQLELGASATAFDAARNNFILELVQCQRFYQKTFPYGTAPAQNAGTTGVVSRVIDFSGSTKYSLTWPFITRMRTTPTIVTFNPSAANSFMRDITAGADVGAGITPAFTSDLTSLLQLTAAATPAVGAALGLHATADAEI